MFLKDKLPELSPSIRELPDEAEWRKALLKAAELIRTHGLAKWRREDECGRLCLQGAISKALTGDAEGRDSDRATNAVHRHLIAMGVPRELTSPNGNAIWNNQPERTADQVINALEAAAFSLSALEEEGR